MVRDETVSVSNEAIELMRKYPWPGNVRELRNIVERALVLAPKGLLTPECLPVEIYNRKKVVTLPAPSNKKTGASTKSLADLEKEQILSTLNRVNWHRGKAANLLGITPKTLYRKLRSYDLADQ